MKRQQPKVGQLDQTKPGSEMDLEQALQNILAALNRLEALLPKLDKLELLVRDELGVKR